jgi:DUF4097 and DUF4098 domain-containing protein YvlB
MRRETFETPGPLELNIRVPTGGVYLETVEGSETLVEISASPEIEDAARVELHPRRDGHEVTVVIEKKGLRSFRDDVRVRISSPPGADVDLSTASADVEAHGDFGSTKVNTASGDIQFEHIAGNGQINSASGDIELERVDGTLNVNTASGDVEVRRIGGDAKVRAASGDIQVHEADASLKVQTASGDVEAGSVREGEVTLQTASGDIEVGIKQGSKLFIDAKSMSGETSSELELGDAPSDGDGPQVDVRATAMSGDIKVKRA